MKLVKIFTFFALFSFTVYFIMLYKWIWKNEDNETNINMSGSSSYFKELDELKNIELLVNTSRCKIPQIDIYDVSIIKFIQKNREYEYDCWEKAVRKWSYTIGKKIYLNETDIKLSGFRIKDLDCCYKPIFRVNQDINNYDFNADRTIEYAQECIPFEGKSSLVSKHEFIKIICEINQDLLNNLAHAQPQINRILYTQLYAFPLLPPDVIFKKQHFWSKKSQKPPNILIIGIDSTSRSNFHRNMPKTREIIEKLGLIELLGYTKVGENTFPNAIAFLTGNPQEKILPNCCPKPDQLKIDNCPFLWFKMKQLNYLNAYIEDAPGFGNFNYHKVGFVQKPTDFYFRPLMLAFKNNWPDTYPSTFGCFGHRTVIQLMMDYIKNVFNECINELLLPLFATIWLTNYSHAFQNELQFIDENIYDFFKFMNTTGILDNSLIFFLSDHGYRYGDIRKTYSGWYEDKLPFIYIHLPKMIKNHHQNWIKNLKINTKRLTTPFDIYETIIHTLENFVQNDSNAQNRTKYGQSLFDEIPENRTCSEASIPSEYCACDFPIKIQNLHDPQLITSAEISVNEINRILNSQKDSSTNELCHKFQVDKIINGAVKEGWVNTNILSSYHVIFSVKPGGYTFESTVEFFRHYENKPPKLSSKVQRMDKIDQSKIYCVRGTNLENYCYCL